MTQTVIFLTIGEAPREDLSSTFDRYFSGNPNILQDGLLNGWSLEKATKEIGVDEQTRGTLTSRFLTGESMEMDHDKVECALQQRINEWEAKGAYMIVLLCTGNFSNLSTQNSLLIEAEKVTLPYVKKVYKEKAVGVLVPLENQKKESKEKWALGARGFFSFASPYTFTEETFQKGVYELEKHQVEVIVLDCIGYNDEMSAFVSSLLPDCAVVQSNDILFQFVDHALKIRQESLA